METPVNTTFGQQLHNLYNHMETRLKAPNLAFNLPNAHSMMSFHCKVSFQCIALAYSFHHLHTTSLGMVTEDKLERQVQKLQLVLHYKNSSLARRNDVTLPGHLTTTSMKQYL